MAAAIRSVVSPSLVKLTSSLRLYTPKLPSNQHFTPFRRRGISVAASVELVNKSTDGDNKISIPPPVNQSQDIKVTLPTNRSSPELLRIRHTCAHVMAMAVQKVFPNAKVTIGPWIDNGFYYDFDMDPLTDKDLKRIKKEMDRIIRRNLPLVREEVTREEAQKRITAINEPYKMEILESIKDESITIYHIGNEWWDLCAGPHVESTGNINRKAVELESVAGAYWRGDTDKPMLQRIYGTAWENEEQLKAYAHFKEEAKRRDHRRIGQDLDLFSIQDEAGGGLVFWHPKGSIVRHMIEDSWKKIHIRQEYDLLYTPHVARAYLWKISGHLDFYRENMYDQMNIEEELYQLRPMNCPYHILVYKRKLHSYRDFPIRVAELGTVYRYELSGALHGLFRVRGFTQDDAHIFCLEGQIKDEIRGVLDLTEEILLQFGFEKYEVNLSTRPEKSVGSNDVWEKATLALKDALEDKGWNYEIDEGGGAFYGPKIDLKIEDALGRKWQCSTIQVDFNLPQRFDITYVDSDSVKRRPIMIHRAVLGSLERFFGVLIEHYAGDFPLWLSPIQARILPVTDMQLDYCKEVTRKMKANGIRAEVCSGERLPKLIRNAEKQKIPLMAVVGPKEVETVVHQAVTTDGGLKEISTKFRLPRYGVVVLGSLLINLNQGEVIDAKQSGAKGDGATDDSKAITSAWQQACSSPTPSKLVIPPGQYAAGPMTFLGPCKAPITIQFEGNLKAPADLNKLKSQDGWIVFQQIDALTLNGGVFDGQGQVAWSQNNCAQTGKCNNLPINIRFNKVTNSMVQGITSVDSKLFHMNILQCQNLTLSHITINAPADSLNTDGIHIGRSSGIRITDSDIKTGDDCVSMGDGSQQVTIEKVTCGPGHGISVGSLGKYHDEQPVMGVFVRDCTFTNTMNGVRVKTWPASPNGICQDLHFENLKMDNVGTPILIDQMYCPYGQCQAQAPSKVKISQVSFKGITGTSSTKVALKIACSKGIPCQNVELSDINLQYQGKDGGGVSQCSNVQPTITGQVFPQACSEAP